MVEIFHISNFCVKAVDSYKKCDLKSVTKRWESISKNIKIDKISFLRILTIILRTGYFKINDEFYLQKVGTGIGIPRSSVTVDLIMEDLLDGIMDELGYDPLICVKYVDC
jgi:hypothetical protein